MKSFFSKSLQPFSSIQHLTKQEARTEIALLLHRRPRQKGSDKNYTRLLGWRRAFNTSVLSRSNQELETVDLLAINSFLFEASIRTL